MRLPVLIMVIWLLTLTTPRAAVDTLKGTSDMVDAVVYSWSDCNGEISGENCLRYNGGGVYNMGVGLLGSSQDRRVLVHVPGWDGSLPDSSEFKVYCYVQSGILQRRIFLYPLTSPFIVGNESAYGLGDYPDPDSGVTWLHRYLDAGDADSLSWDTPGGDFTTAVACTTTISGTGQYFSFRNFNRILEYWDTTGANFGFILVNENDYPYSLSAKILKSSEAGPGYYPLLILYTADTISTGTSRRRRIVSSLAVNSTIN